MKRNGFTLMEMLVALVLVGLIASLGATLLPAMKRGAGRSEEFQRRAAELGRSHEFLRALIENTIPPDGLDRGIAPPSFDAARLDLVTRLPEELGKGGLQRVSLSVEGLEGHRSLRLDVQSLRNGAQGTKGNLIEDATQIAWSYFDRRTGAWSDRAAADGALPDLIRLSVETRQTGRWPPLIAAPRLDGGVLCAFDMLAKICRDLRS